MVATPIELFHYENQFEKCSKSDDYNSTAVLAKLQYNEGFENMVRVRSNGGVEKHACICTALRPLLKAFQILGIFPISHDASTCKMGHSWFSPFAFINFAWFSGNISLCIYMYTFASNYISEFKGVDFYTISLVLILQWTTTVLVFFSGNFNSAEFCKGEQYALEYMLIIFIKQAAQLRFSISKN